MSATTSEPTGCLRPPLALEFGEREDRPDYGIGLRAKDRCHPMTPLGLELLGLHLITHTMHTRAR